MTKAIRSVGTRLLVGLTSPIAVGGLSNIGSPSITTDEIDVTDLDSDGGFREFIGGFKDPGDVALEGNARVTDSGELNAGQQRMYDLLYSGATEDFIIAFPPGFQAVWKFRGIVTAFATPFALEDAVGFNATIRVSGMPELLTGADATPYLPT